MISNFISTINASLLVINTHCNFRNFYRFPHWDRLDNDAKEIENDEKMLAIETRRIENERIQFFLQRAKECDLAAAKELERSKMILWRVLAYIGLSQAGFSPFTFLVTPSL